MVTKLLQGMGERLKYLSSQDGLLLLRHSFSIPKVLHLLRSAPTFVSSGLTAYDEVQSLHPGVYHQCFPW